MRKFVSLLSLIALIVSLMQPVSAKEPTIKDLALQAGAGLIGYYAGNITGSIGYYAVIISSKQQPFDCDLLQFEISQGGQGESEWLRSFCSTFQIVELMLRVRAASAVGSAVGAFSGELSASEAQGYHGNILAATLGLMSGFLVEQFLDSSFASSAIMADMLPFIKMYDAKSTQENSQQVQQNLNKSFIVSMLTPLILIAAAMLGYHIF